jgi:5'-3' exonuclease
MFMTGDSNFRYQIYPEYKAQRLKVAKPRHLKHLQEYITSTYDATWSNNCEADDLMGIAQCASDEDTTIVSIDKDLLMIPGKHYQWEIRGNSGGKAWVKEAKNVTISHLEGMKWFYTQCLTGDSADNIKGASGVGKVGAARILDACETEQEMFEAVRDSFSLDEEFLMNAQVLWIMRKENDIYQFPEYAKEKTEDV